VETKASQRRAMFSMSHLCHAALFDQTDPSVIPSRPAAGILDATSAASVYWPSMTVGCFMCRATYLVILHHFLLLFRVQVPGYLYLLLRQVQVPVVPVLAFRVKAGFIQSMMRISISLMTRTRCHNRALWATVLLRLRRPRHLHRHRLHHLLLMCIINLLQSSF
jgi:hypothetical protein